MNTVAKLSVPHLAPVPKQDSKTLVQAARQFEAILLNTLLEPLEHSFTSLSGEKGECGSENYGYLGMQALTTTLAEGGGLGIADMIVRNLHRAGPPTVGPKQIDQEKSPA